MSLSNIKVVPSAEVPAPDPSNSATIWLTTDTNEMIASNGATVVTPGVSDLSALSDVDVAGAVDGSILRYDTGTSKWEDTTGVLINDNGQLQVPSGATAGVLVGNAQLYQLTPGAIRTDSILVGGGTYIMAHEASTGGFLRRGTGTVGALHVLQVGDTQDRLYVDTNGKHQWGDGTAVPDVDLSRTSAGVLSLGSGQTLAADQFRAFSRVQLMSNSYVDGQNGNVAASNLLIGGLASDAGLRIRINRSGRIDIGDGASGTLDTTLQRASADVLQTPDRFQADDGLTTKVKAGAPVDGDFAQTPADGTMVLDSTNERLYVRVGGAWKYSQLV